MRRRQKKNRFSFTLIKLFLIALISLANIIQNSPNANAAEATLFIFPNTGSYTIGDVINVTVSVNSGGDPGINAADGVITYNTDVVTVKSVSKASSIFSLWTSEPSGSGGKINFSGGTPSPYKGNSGNIFTVTLEAKSAGTAKLNFSTGLVLAADGKGTNILKGMGGAEFTINEPKPEPEKKPEPVKEPQQIKQPEEKPEEKVGKGVLPPLPEIISQSHPDENVWYPNNEPDFSWKLLSDLTGVSYSVTDKANSDPGSSADGVVESIILDKQEDGEWYFNLKYQNKYGWGEIAHKKFMIDVTKPDPFLLIIDNEKDPTNPTPKIKFTTKDEASGIDYFNITIDQNILKVLPGEVSSGFYQPSPLSPGEHKISVVAYDKAQNAASSSATFIIEPLKSPIIKSIPQVITKKEDLIIQGESFYERVTVKLYIAKEGEDPKEYTLKADDGGAWSFFNKRKIDKGNYEVWAKIVDDRGAESLNSAKHILTVESPSIIDSYGLFIVLLLLLLLILAILYIIYSHSRFNQERVRIKVEVDEVKSKLRKIFAALSEEVDELIEMADKKPGLSEAERKVKEKLQESLDISEEFISKEVEDIEKEINISSQTNERK